MDKSAWRKEKKLLGRTAVVEVVGIGARVKAVREEKSEQL